MSWIRREIRHESGGQDGPMAFAGRRGLLCRANDGYFGPASQPTDLLLRAYDDGRILARYPFKSRPLALAASPWGDVAIAAGASIWRIDLVSGAVTDLGHCGQAVAAGRDFFVVADGARLRVLDRSGKPLHEHVLTGYGRLTVEHLAVAADGSVIAADDGGRMMDEEREKVTSRGTPQVRLWKPGENNTRLLREYPVYKWPSGMAMTPARDLLAVWGLEEIEVFRLTDSTVISRYRADRDGDLRSAAFLSDGSTLAILREYAVQDEDETDLEMWPSVFLWNVHTSATSDHLYGEYDPGKLMIASAEEPVLAITENRGLRIFRQQLGMRVAATAIEPPDDGKCWAFHLINDSDQPLHSLALTGIDYEWGDSSTSRKVSGTFGPVAPGGSVELFRDQDSEVRVSLHLVVDGKNVTAEFGRMYAPDPANLVPIPLLGRSGEPAEVSFSEPPAGTIQIDEVGVRRWLATGCESVRWDSLVKVEIVTTDEGPLVEDVFIVLHGSDGKGCVVPSSHDGILPWLQKLPGFDNEAFIQAMSSCEDARFLVWQR
jgi:hypothetical protein